MVPQHFSDHLGLVLWTGWVILLQTVIIGHTCVLWMIQARVFGAWVSCYILDNNKCLCVLFKLLKQKKTASQSSKKPLFCCFFSPCDFTCHFQLNRLMCLVKSHQTGNLCPCFSLKSQTCSVTFQKCHLILQLREKATKWRLDNSRGLISSVNKAYCLKP